jgi:hypothetical protein
MVTGGQTAGSSACLKQNIWKKSMYSERKRLPVPVTPPDIGFFYV